MLICSEHVLRRNVLGLLILTLTACRSGPSTAEGNYLVRFVWDEGLKSADVVQERPDHRPSAKVRKQVVSDATVIITEQLKEANLTKAQGQLELTLGPAPHAVVASDIEIVTPRISELLGAVELEDIAKINDVVSRYHNVNQRELPSRRTALFMAAAGCHVRSLERLLDIGADPNVGDFEGDTPLEAAVVAGDQMCTRLLINAGARIDQPNGVGMTPLMKTADLGRTEIIAELLGSGANPDLKASNGKTAIMFARESRHKKATAILEHPDAPK